MLWHQNNYPAQGMCRQCWKGKLTAQYGLITWRRRTAVKWKTRYIRCTLCCCQNPFHFWFLLLWHKIVAMNCLVWHLCLWLWSDRDFCSQFGNRSIFSKDDFHFVRLPLRWFLKVEAHHVWGSPSWENRCSLQESQSEKI